MADPGKTADRGNTNNKNTQMTKTPSPIFDNSPGPTSNPDGRARDDGRSHRARDIKCGTGVVAAEIAGLETLSRALQQEPLRNGFSQAIDTFIRATGRIVVSGLGKSGHVARKIAATFASTGTPAQFVHPSEASHGDMGMITSSDAVLMLSNSGENRELGDLIAHTRRVGVPLVAVSSGAASTLMNATDIGLLLPPAQEACPMGLAPTTSSTMMLALGDALAVTLMQRRGFSADDYRVLHPGGQWGKALLRVQDIMHSGDDLPLVGPDTRVSDTLVEMTSKRFGCVGVLDPQNGLIGIFTDGDLRRQMHPDLFGRKVAEVMTPGPKTIRRSALVQEAVNFMNSLRIMVLFVVEDGHAPDGTVRPVGILHMHDCLRAGIS